ncbi:MAG: hypothetical protein ACREQ4_14760 [Candidatus Binataceae bacterium]
MDAKSQSAGPSRVAQWLEIIDGNAPIVLIAPHGGRAGPAAFAKLHPKVNDLETAAITRELARRLDASALINTGMDRNQLDCNRVPQLTSGAPWMLAMIAERLESAVTCASRVTVLLVHGWNIIEPRIDLGLGLRESNGRLVPPAGAHVSASDAFIQGPVAELAALLRKDGIIPSYGLRYPGGGVQNLLQVFTSRHHRSPIGALRKLAELAERGHIEALQLELSVALRLPGTLRARALDSISAVFSVNRTAQADHSALSVMPAIVRQPLPRAAGSNAQPAMSHPVRVGVEFYDAAARVGGMVSFDFGAKAAGGRIMLLYDGCRVALFTAEGKARSNHGTIALGPLRFHLGRSGTLRFRGPAVVVNDGSAYLSVERALASGSLDGTMEISAGFALSLATPEFGDFEDIERMVRRLYRPDEDGRMNPARAAYGRLRGSVTLGGCVRNIDACARVGVSFSGLGPQRFETRRMLWAYLERPDGGEPLALEARMTSPDGREHQRGAWLLYGGAWHACGLGQIILETCCPERPPNNIEALIEISPGVQKPLTGCCETFMTLSRPGPDDDRVHTSLGFARFRIGELTGVGMFEYSRPATPLGDEMFEDGDEIE